MADGDLEIELKEEDEAKGPDGGAVEGAKSDAISGDIADVQRRLDEAEARATVAEQRANAALQRAAAVESGANGDRLAMVQSALDTIEANVATLQGQMAEAMAIGDFAKHAELNVALANQIAAKPDLLRGKAALEQQARQPAAPLPGEITDQQKVDTYVAKMAPRAAGWIRAHPQYVTDPKLNTKLLARHWAALEADHVEGSDGYFRFIEDGLALPQGNGYAAPAPIPVAATTDTTQPLSAAAAPTQRRGEAQPSAAAPSRGGGGSRKITLTPAQQEAARISGQTYEEYGKAMERERRAGNIGKPH